MPSLLDREEYVEQAYFFRAMGDRMRMESAAQDLLVALKDELLATSKLSLALDFMAAELRLRGVISSAMARLPHYFTRFQTYLIAEAERETGRFDLNRAMEILRFEAEYRAAGAAPQGSFLYQFEALCRNRLGYDGGLAAMAEDPIYDEPWRAFLRDARRQIAVVDLADLIYVRSEYYLQQRKPDAPEVQPGFPALFGPREGRIALANRRRDPLLLFAAMQRHLNYPAVPRPVRREESVQVLPQLLRRVERLEARLKLLEEEQKGGIDLTKFFGPPDSRPPNDLPPLDYGRSSE